MDKVTLSSEQFFIILKAIGLSVIYWLLMLVLLPYIMECMNGTSFQEISIFIAILIVAPLGITATVLLNANFGIWFTGAFLSSMGFLLLSEVGADPIEYVDRWKVFGDSFRQACLHGAVAFTVCPILGSLAADAFIRYRFSLGCIKTHYLIMGVVSIFTTFFFMLYGISIVNEAKHENIVEYQQVQSVMILVTLGFGMCHTLVLSKWSK